MKIDFGDMFQGRSLFASRKFKACVLTVVIVGALRLWAGMEISEGLQLASPILGWAGLEGVRDWLGSLRKGNDPPSKS